MTRNNRAWQAVVFAIGLLAFAGSIVAAERYRLVGRQELRRAIAELYTAEQAGDWTAFYRMTSPEFRKEVTLEAFLTDKGARDFRVVSWRIDRLIPLERELDASDVESAASAAMHVIVERSGGEREIEKDQTDYWVRVGGRWYWYWRGWPAD